jgi:hypothetical protein
MREHYSPDISKHLRNPVNFPGFIGTGALERFWPGGSSRIAELGQSLDVAVPPGGDFISIGRAERIGY